MREIRVDADHTFDLKIFTNNIQDVPTAVTCEIFDNSGKSLQSGAGGVDADGTITFTFLAANNGQINCDFKILFNYTVNSVASQQASLFDVVTHPLVNNVSDEDLFARVEGLRKVYEKQSRTTADGTTNTFIDDQLPIDRRQWRGGIGELFFKDPLSKINIVHQFGVTAYAKASGTITFTPAYSSAILAQTNYVIRETYSSQIEIAFKEVVSNLRGKVGLAAGYIDSNVVSDLVVFKALAIICAGKVEVSEDKWDFRRKEFVNEFGDRFSRWFEAYDLTNDGNISDSELEAKPNFSTISMTDEWGRL